jgi:hypothetical protein
MKGTATELLYSSSPARSVFRIPGNDGTRRSLSQVRGDVTPSKRSDPPWRHFSERRVFVSRHWPYPEATLERLLARWESPGGFKDY